MKPKRCPVGGRHRWAPFAPDDVMDDYLSLPVQVLRQANMVVHCVKCRRSFRAVLDLSKSAIGVDESEPTRWGSRRRQAGRR